MQAIWWSWLAHFVGKPYLVGRITGESGLTPGWSNMQRLRFYLAQEGIDVGEVWANFIAHFSTFDLPLLGPELHRQFWNGDSNDKMCTTNSPNNDAGGTEEWAAGDGTKVKCVENSDTAPECVTFAQAQCAGNENGSYHLERNDETPHLGDICRSTSGSSWKEPIGCEKCLSVGTFHTCMNGTQNVCRAAQKKCYTTCCSKSSILTQVGPLNPTLGTDGVWLPGPELKQPGGFASNLIL